MTMISVEDLLFEVREGLDVTRRRVQGEFNQSPRAMDPDMEKLPDLDKAYWDRLRNKVVVNGKPMPKGYWRK